MRASDVEQSEMKGEMALTVQETAASATPRYGRRAWLRISTKDKLIGVALIVPTLLVFTVVVAMPLVRGVLLGFYNVQQITLKTRFTGLANFVRVLDNGSFGHSLWVTVQYTLGTVILETVIGIAVAVMLNQKFYGRTAARSIAIFPYLVPIIVSATVWRWLLNDTYGIVDSTLMQLGLINRPILWFADPNLALLSVILVSTWRTFPFIVIASLGRMQNIPRQLYDAARTDGASSWAQFWDITLPQLRSVLLVTVFLRFIWDFNDYATIALLTGGGPVERTTTIPILIYQLAFGQHSLGTAAAVADLALVFLSLFFIAYFWIAKPMGEKT